MQPTRRYWEAVTIAAVLGGGALTFDRPLLLTGAALLFGWLLAVQVAFVITASRFDDSFRVSQILDTGRAFTDDPVAATLTATADPTPLDVTVTARPSAGLDAAGRLETTLNAETTFSVRTNITGTHRLRDPRIELADPMGLFVERFTRGPEAEIVVEARPLPAIHIGRGGEGIAHAFGDHTLDTTGPGIVPAELHPYHASEPASRIDWKATARMNTAYVREFQAESDRPNVVILDSRSRRRSDPEVGDEVAYLRGAALTYVTSTEQLSGPLGCISVNGDGIERLTATSNATRGYELARRRLRDVTASPVGQRRRLAPPLRYRADSLESNSRFGDVLQSYTVTRPVIDPASRPLETAVRTALHGQESTVRVALFTVDADRAGIREAISAARETDNFVSVFLAPQVLHGSSTPESPERVAELYEDFEAFRRELSRIEGVTAYEVAPEPRIEAIVEI